MRTKLEVKRIDLWSLFKIAFFLYGTMGLVAGLCYGFFLLLAGVLEHTFLDEGFPELGIIGGALGFLLIPVIAIFYGAIGSVFVTIFGVLYNMFANLVGGIRVETQVDMGESPPAIAPSDSDDSLPTI